MTDRTGAGLRDRRDPRAPTAIQRGLMLAALATLAFGVTTPLIARAGATAGPWSAAGWLYLGAAAFALAAGRGTSGFASIWRRRWPLLAALALVGATLAPAAYIAGLRGAGPVAASLALNMEAPFSALIAVCVFGEFLGRRAGAALVLIVAAASVLAFAGSAAHRGAGEAGLGGVALVTLATALWAVDNALASRLGDVDPRVTVFWKSALGSALALGAGRFAGESPGNPASIAALAGIGAVGYGGSLVLYLLAQRRVGVARTASVFALAPLAGAVAAIPLTGARVDAAAIVAFALMCGGVLLHVTERHDHEHQHAALEHEHAHRHDDLHHDHAHAAAPLGEHRHRHVHSAITHTHDHAADAEHVHPH